MATDSGVAAAEVAATSRFVRSADHSEGAVDSLRRQLHLPTPVDYPLGTCVMDAARVVKNATMSKMNTAVC